MLSRIVKVSNVLADLVEIGHLLHLLFNLFEAGWSLILQIYNGINTLRV